MKKTEKQAAGQPSPRRWLRKGMSLVLSCSLVLSGAAFTGLSGWVSIAQAVETEGDGSLPDSPEPAETQAPAPTNPGDLMDQETGFTYTLYEQTAEGEMVQTASITGYAGTEPDLVIPAAIGEYPVGSIGDGAFMENPEITSVSISEGVTDIGYQAFFGCENLVRVTIPASITNWVNSSQTNYNNRAFEGCTALTELTLTEGLTTLGQCSFLGCTALEKVVVPSTICTFGNKTFSGCSSLKELELTEGMTAIGFCAFEECTALEEVAIPSTIQKWDTLHANGIMQLQTTCSPFQNCTALKKVTFAEGLETLMYFNGVKGCPLVKELDIPASVTNTDYAFKDCTDLERITFHEGLETIGQAAFQGCTSLRELRIPGSVKAVKFQMFANCTALERIIVMPTAANIPHLALTTCPALKEVDILAGRVADYSCIEVPATAVVYGIGGSDTYEDCLALMTQTGMEDMLKTFSPAGAQVEGCMIPYDGEEHDAVMVTGCQEGDEIVYRIGGEGEFTTEMPRLTQRGEYSVEVVVLRSVEGEPLQVSSQKVQAEITKWPCSIHLADVTIEEGEDYQIVPEEYEGDAEIVLAYFKDAGLQEVCDGKPDTAGVYYVKATAAATEEYLAAESNVAKITITEKNTPEPTPTNNPGATPTQIPGTEPTDEPSPEPTQKPGSEPPPVSQPTKSPAATPGPVPKVTPKPVEKPQVKKVTLKKAASPAKKKLAVTWKKLTGAAGYQIQIATNRKFTKGKKSVIVKKAKTIQYRFKKLKRKKKYYVRIRAYKTVNGKRYYGSWSGVKTAKVK